MGGSSLVEVEVGCWVEAGPVAPEEQEHEEWRAFPSPAVAVGWACCPESTGLESDGICLEEETQRCEERTAKPTKQVVQSL